MSALSVGIIAGAWLLSIGEPEIEPSPATALVSSASVEPQHKPAVNVEQASPPAQSDFLHDVALRPEEVLGNLECTVMPGRGAASNTAIVVLRTETGARFSVVDGRGTVVSDDVPFRPHHYRLGKRNDGTPLVGLGDLRLNSKTSRPVDSPEPVRIYLGKQLVYESEKAWDFIVAHDGSSFAVHEPLAGDGSRLVVHDLDRSEERHFDLGTRMTPVNAYEREHMIAYTLDGTEIMFHPSDGDAMGVGTYWFYPVGDGPTRRITVEGGRSAFLISSREGYFTEQPEDLKPDEYPGVSQVTRRRFDAASNTTDDRWSRRLDLNRFDGTISLSDNGRWLSVDGWDFHVLDAESGDTVFKYPRVGYPEQQLARLVSVVGEDASASDVGSVGHIRFMGDMMMFFRDFGRLDCPTPPGEEYDHLRYGKCLGELRKSGRYRAVYDVYDMETITLDAQPIYRAEVFRETSCKEGNVPFRGLQSVGGQLAYLANTR